MDDNIIELHNVELKNDRDEYVFRDLNFKLENGKSAVISGPAGSGKTTLIELLIGLRFPEYGSVEVFGNLVSSRSRRVIKRVRRQIGGVGGPFGLVPSYTVAENITLPLVLTGAETPFRKQRLREVLTEFSLLKQAGEYPDSLTRVESTLTQFARASVAHQPLLLIDEPYAGLDRPTFERIHAYLLKVAESGRSMVILSSEYLPVEIPDTRFYQLSNGTLV
jgi:ABC-type ATPase involved in cell division